MHAVLKLNHKNRKQKICIGLIFAKLFFFFKVILTYEDLFPGNSCWNRHSTWNVVFCIFFVILVFKDGQYQRIKWFQINSRVFILLNYYLKKLVLPHLLFLQFCGLMWECIFVSALKGYVKSVHDEAIEYYIDISTTDVCALVASKLQAIKIKGFLVHFRILFLYIKFKYIQNSGQWNN